MATSDKPINELIEKMQILSADTIDFVRFNSYAITHHSTSIEGSTLSAEETVLLLDKGLTPNQKPLIHSLMVQDHYHALLFCINQAKEKTEMTPALIQNINKKVMQSTGTETNAMAGSFDSSQGEFRKLSVRAGNRLFPDYQKVPKLVETLCEELHQKIKTINKNNFTEVYDLSFEAHYQLVSIHPFADGNGRTSRLLMNFIQAFFDLPLSLVYADNRTEYFEALEKTREKEDTTHVKTFMYLQLERFFEEETTLKPTKNIKNDKGISFLF